MTYNVFGGTLSLTQKPIKHWWMVQLNVLLKGQQQRKYTQTYV